MTKVPTSTSQTETYPGKLPEILQHRASIVSDGIRRILEVVPAASAPVVRETQVLDSGMSDEQKRERLQNMEPFTAENTQMPQDVYIEALASETPSETDTTVSLDMANADLLGTAQAALRDIFGPGSDE